jgi:CheY-like chemotaxis protein
VLLGESTIDELLRVVDVPQEEGTSGFSKEQDSARRFPARRRDSGGSAAVKDPPTSDQRSSGPIASLEGAFELLEPVEPARPRMPGAFGEIDSIKVLLVDDEDQLRKVMKDLLERDGYDVEEASDGVQALDQVDRHAPDIIVLDLNLPGLDGFGVLTHLRSRPATSEIPVVVLTAHGDEESEVRVFELGADDFLSKPFRARTLSARLQAVLGRRRGAR